MSLSKFAVFLIGFTATSGQILLLREFISTFHGNELVIGIYLSVWLLATALGSGPMWRFLPRRTRSWRASAGGRAASPDNRDGTPANRDGSVEAHGASAGDRGGGAEHRDTTPVVTFAIVESLVGGALLFAVLGLLLPPVALRPAPGEVSGLLAPLACCGIFLTPFCLLQGLLFPLGTKLLRSERPYASVSRVYLLEAAGAAAGGLLLSLFLVHVLSSFQNAALICTVNLLAAGILLERASRRRLRHLCTLAAAVTVILCVLDPVTLWVTSRKWGAFDVVAVRQSRYGNLAVVSIDSQFSVYQDGLLVFTTEDARSAEQIAHLSLLQHPSPAHVLLMGGGMGGVAREALKHKELRRMDYVELDPELIALSREVLPEQDLGELDDPRLTIHLTDARRYLKRSAGQYDVIIMQIPPPYTAQLNRFYTKEFFAMVRERLEPEGVFVFSAPGVADYVGDEMASFLGSLLATSESVFERSTMIPAGQTLFALSLKGNHYVTAAAESLLSRLAARDIETLYVRDYFLLSALSSERVSYVQERTASVKGNLANTDLRPTSFYYDLILWSAEYERVVKRPLEWLFHNPWSVWVLVLGAAVTLVITGRWGRRRERVVLSTLTISGFAGIVLELEIILCFQLLYGGLYDRVGILLTSYMAGLAIGTALERRATPADPGSLFRPAMIQMGTAGFALLFLGVVCAAVGMKTGSSVVLEWLFPLFAIGAGALGGALFASASRVFFESRSTGGAATGPRNGPSENSSGGPGLTYAWDLVGSCVGGAVCSAVMFPVVGVVSATAVVAVLLVASGGSLLLSGSTQKTD